MIFLIFNFIFYLFNLFILFYFIIIIIFKGIPNAEARKEILEVLLRNVPHSLTDEDITRISSITHGYVGADLASLCREAGLKTIKRTIKMKEELYSKGLRNADGNFLFKNFSINTFIIII